MMFFTAVIYEYCTYIILHKLIKLTYIMSDSPHFISDHIYPMLHVHWPGLTTLFQLTTQDL